MNKPSQRGNTVIYLMLTVIMSMLIIIMYLLVGGAKVPTNNLNNPTPLANECTYNGRTYQVGQSFDADDGCNTCSCSNDGQVSCTLMFCVDDGTPPIEPMPL